MLRGSLETALTTAVHSYHFSLRPGLSLHLPHHQLVSLCLIYWECANQTPPCPSSPFSPPALPLCASLWLSVLYFTCYAHTFLLEFIIFALVCFSLLSSFGSPFISSCQIYQISAMLVECYLNNSSVCLFAMRMSLMMLIIIIIIIIIFFFTSFSTIYCFC